MLKTPGLLRREGSKGSEGQLGRYGSTLVMDLQALQGLGGRELRWKSMGRSSTDAGFQGAGHTLAGLCWCEDPGVEALSRGGEGTHCEHIPDSSGKLTWKQSAQHPRSLDILDTHH